METQIRFGCDGTMSPRFSDVIWPLSVVELAAELPWSLDGIKFP